MRAGTGSMMNHVHLITYRLGKHGDSDAALHTKKPDCEGARRGGYRVQSGFKGGRPAKPGHLS